MRTLHLSGNGSDALTITSSDEQPEPWYWRVTLHNDCLSASTDVDLNVSDIAETIRWFEKLGWTVGFEWQDDPADPNSPVNFASVTCGDREIFLCRGAQGGRGKGSNSAGLEITYPPTKMAWGVREMHVRHRDGHVFRISTRSF